MSSRILLVNFTKAEADKLKMPETIELNRGYLSDILPDDDESFESEDKKDVLRKIYRAYFPLAIHEYKAIFVKLHTTPDV